MKLNKYEWMFIRMMIKMFLLIVALITVMKMINIPIKAIYITFAVLLGLSYLVKRVYWNHLEKLELQEKIGGIIHIILIFLIVLNGCTRIEQNKPLEETSLSNISYTTEKYNGTDFYCFYDKYYQKGVCLPYTQDVKENVIDYGNLTDYRICNINGSCINISYNIQKEGI